MAMPAGLITHPIALCAYVLALVFGLLAKKWNSRNSSGRYGLDRQLFRLAVFVSVTALAGGLILAWHQTERTSASVTEPEIKSAATGGPNAGGTAAPVGPQSTTGTNSSNVQNSGSGSVTVQYGNALNPPPVPPEEKK